MSSFGAKLISKLRGKGTDSTVAPFPGMDLLETRALRVNERSHLESQIRSRTSYASISSDTGLARVLGRYKMFVIPDDDAISAHLILDGFWEMWNTLFLASFVRPGWSVLEIGSNLGYFSLLLSDLVGPTGKLIGFEPVTRNADLLRRTISINGFADRFSIEQVAVAETNRRARIHVPTGNWGGGSIMGGPSPNLALSEDVEVISLDNYCLGKAIAPDFIKMDAEAAERDIWRGMSNLVSRQQKLAVMFEFDARRNLSWRSWFEEIERQNFHLYRVGYDAKPQRILASTPEPADMFEVLALKGYPEKN